MQQRLEASADDGAERPSGATRLVLDAEVLRAVHGVEDVGDLAAGILTIKLSMLIGRRCERLLEPRVLGEACRVVAAEDHLDEGSLGYHDSVSGGMGEKDEGEHASPQKTTRRRSASASDGRARV
jgi:hypothetical protein